MTSRLFDFDNTYASVLPELGLEWKPLEVPSPELVAFNQELAEIISIEAEALGGEVGAQILGGNEVPEGAAPLAMAYAGHQFGGYSPRLGDGRALLLGEVVGTDGRRVDIHLKGSGRTPFSRGGDGKATVGPMLREFLFAEAMHALGVPTGRALAVVTTGEQVWRERPEPGAVLTRVASSHLRVGTFEYAARLEDPSVLKKLADYAIERHYQEAVDSALAATGQGRYVTLLEAVIQAQAELVAQWMLLGFIHGVMNTDNTTISGETIDYGPCAFMDRYDPATVYSSIDHQGRYSYGNQPIIAQWNLARLAETLLPLMAADSGQEPEAMVPVATEVLESFGGRFQRELQSGMEAKLGLSSGGADLVPTLAELLHSQRVDYTSFFRRLADAVVADDDDVVREFVAPADGAGTELVDKWLAQWRAELGSVDRDRSEVAARMNEVNPIYIPRNHLVDEALNAATDGDLTLFEQLLPVVTDPFVEREGLERYAQPAPEDFDKTFRTFCGT